VTDVAAPVDPPAPPGPQPPARHTARWVGVIVLVAAAGLIAVLATRPPAMVSAIQSPLLGKMAPPIGGLTLDGQKFALPKVPGAFVVVNFFADWCQPCRSEGPDLVKFAFEHQQSGDARLVSVVFNDTPSAARSYQAMLGANWPTLADPQGNLALSYGVRGPPSTFLIAPDGRMVAYIVAPVTADDLDQLIARAKADGA
jgi:cytochrome c biogenesis protein CcmG/thiol:disulfide interchange protein DsbE